MIRVENLVKNFGATQALKGISFKVEKGEILGLLGPNGAGKTTTMRILTGYMAANSGEAYIGDIEVHKNPIEAKKLVGYLPENPPVYKEMRVIDYLIFCAELQGVEKTKIKDRVDYSLNAAAITHKAKSIIGTLSKGYRQRVGLAQALVHNPPVLIFDEPTVGLDPTQIIEIRNLIRSLKGEKTIILSTHILPEVTETCERVVIISNGEVVTQETLKNLLENTNKMIVQVKDRKQEAVNFLKSKDFILDLKDNLQQGIMIETKKDADFRPVITRDLMNAGFEILELKNVNLEHIFLQLTSN